MDINDLVFGGMEQGITPEQQKAIASSLRGRDALGTLMAMTGDRALAPAGKQLVQGASTARNQATMQEYYRNQMKQAAINQMEAARHNRAMEGLSGQQNVLSAALAGMTREGKIDKELDRRTEKFSKELDGSGVIKMGQAFDQMVAEIAPYVGKGKEVPGLGGLNNTPGLGSVLNVASPAGRQVRAAIMNFVSGKAFGEGGKALTAQEKQAIIDSLAYGTFNSDEDFIHSLGRARELINSHIQRATGGAGPEILQRYMDQGGYLPETTLPWNGDTAAPTRGAPQALYEIIQDED